MSEVDDKIEYRHFGGIAYPGRPVLNSTWYQPQSGDADGTVYLHMSWWRVDDEAITAEEAVKQLASYIVKKDSKAVLDMLNRHVGDVNVDTYIPYPLSECKLAQKPMHVNSKCTCLIQLYIISSASPSGGYTAVLGSRGNGCRSSDTAATQGSQY